MAIQGYLLAIGTFVEEGELRGVYTGGRELLCQPLCPAGLWANQESVLSRDFPLRSGCGCPGICGGVFSDIHHCWFGLVLLILQCEDRARGCWALTPGTQREWMVLVSAPLLRFVDMIVGTRSRNRLFVKQGRHIKPDNACILVKSRSGFDPPAARSQHCVKDFEESYQSVDGPESDTCPDKCPKISPGVTLPQRQVLFDQDQYRRSHADVEGQKQVVSASAKVSAGKEYHEAHRNETLRPATSDMPFQSQVEMHALTKMPQRYHRSLFHDLIYMPCLESPVV